MVMNAGTNGSAVTQKTIADPLTRIAFSLHEGRGVFALLVGSGLSRSAEIPTGWEITLDLVRRVALTQGVADQPDWAAWYKEQTGQEPNYSALVRELGATPEERRSILHSYIEPSEEDREQGRKVPTAAHRAIADLVAGGYVKVVVTTNFDRLMENAMRERGIEPTIVASADALAGAEPLAHSSCYLLKLHGDYKDARILNTEDELASYPKQYGSLLDRVFDEYGLIVSGWSGEWDEALRKAMLRAPSRRYPIYWTVRGTIGNGASELIRQRAAITVPISDADSFFTAVAERVNVLEQSQRPNPQSLELLIASAKRFLARPDYRIQLDDLITDETQRVLERIRGAEFSPQGAWSPATFSARILRYEAATESLATMAGVLGRWGDGMEFAPVLDIIRGLYSDAESQRGGLVAYLDIRAYPAVLVFTAYGLGLVRAGRWDVLHRLFQTTLARENREPASVVSTIFLTAWKGGADKSYWQVLEGLDRRKTPLSDHLLDVFTAWSPPFVGVAEFETLFERFEILGSLASLEKYSKDEVQLQLGQSGGQRNWVWMPVGRSSWHRESARELLATLGESSSALTAAGFGHGNPEFIDLFIANFERMAERIRWS
jgi:hypothetical protein